MAEIKRVLNAEVGDLVLRALYLSVVLASTAHYGSSGEPCFTLKTEHSGTEEQNVGEISGNISASCGLAT